MDGKNRTIIINTNVPVTHSLSLDYQHQILYWIDSDYRVLESSTVNGTNRKTIYLFSQSYSFYGISILKIHSIFPSTAAQFTGSAQVDRTLLASVFHISVVTIIVN